MLLGYLLLSLLRKQGLTFDIIESSYQPAPINPLLAAPDGCNLRTGPSWTSLRADQDRNPHHSGKWDDLGEADQPEPVVVVPVVRRVPVAIGAAQIPGIVVPGTAAQNTIAAQALPPILFPAHGPGKH